MASYTRLLFARKTASLSSSLFNISQQQRVRSCFPFCLSPPSRNISELPSSLLLSSSSLSSPLLLLPPEQVKNPNNNNNNKNLVNIPLFSVAENQVVTLRNRILPEEISDAYCTGSSHGWLAYLNGRNCGFYLANIFSPSIASQIIQLPSIESLPAITSVVRDSSSNVVKEYNLHGYPKTPDRLSWLLITRFAMSSAPNNGNDNCTVMIANGGMQVLAFCRIGDTSWTSLENYVHQGYEEIVYSKKDQLFYTLSNGGHVEAWDLRDPASPKRFLIDVGNEFPASHLSKSEIDLRCLCDRNCYLVELSGGDILFVDHYCGFVGDDGTYVKTNPVSSHLPYRTARFDIFKFEFEKKKAEYVTSIGDNALFLGTNHSFSLSTRDHPHLKPNSVYYADNTQEWGMSRLTFDKKIGYPYGGHDMGVYSLEDNSVTPLYHPFEFKKILPPPIWVFPTKD